MKLRLTEKDIQLLKFLGKYKIMLATDSKKIYEAKGYHFKRLKVLEKEKYIKRVNRYYIKLDVNGIKLIKDFGYSYHNICRKSDYQERVKEIVKIATLTIGSTIKFIPSWEIKDNAIFTETARKYIGELIYQGKRYIAYYISNERKEVYIRQIITDIQKASDYKNVMIFVENINVLNKANQYFIFGKECTLIISTGKTKEKMRKFEEFDFYELIKQIYKGKEILLSNWIKADYVTSKKDYIVLMPFLDTEKLHKLNKFYKNNEDTNRKIDIITLSQNIDKINEILTNKANIIELDNLL